MTKYENDHEKLNIWVAGNEFRQATEIVWLSLHQYPVA